MPPLVAPRSLAQATPLPSHMAQDAQEASDAPCNSAYFCRGTAWWQRDGTWSGTPSHMHFSHYLTYCKLKHCILFLFTVTLIQVIYKYHLLKKHMTKRKGKELKLQLTAVSACLGTFLPWGVILSSCGKTVTCFLLLLLWVMTTKMFVLCIFCTHSFMCSHPSVCIASFPPPQWPMQLTHAQKTPPIAYCKT